MCARTHLVILVCPLGQLGLYFFPRRGAADSVYVISEHSAYGRHRNSLVSSCRLLWSTVLSVGCGCKNQAEHDDLKWVCHSRVSASVNLREVSFPHSYLSATIGSTLAA